jgi:hypothetical protein
MNICSYKKEKQCHTLAISIGPHAECSTFNYRGNSSGGFQEVTGGIGACIASDCQFNQELECRDPNIDVRDHQTHADCETYKPKT